VTKDSFITGYLFAIISLERIRAMLEKELAFYEKNLDNWLSLYPGKFILVKGEELVGVYDTNEQALAAGASHFGLASYLIRRVEKSKEDINLPALTLGLLYANPTHSTYSTRTNT
jgi:pilus assembly protein TadC